MKIRVTQTLVFITDIEVTDEIVADRKQLQDHWCSNLIIPASVDELDWVSTDFSNAETDEELGGI